MNSEPEDFAKVTQLLALKRYEQPPPRYFREFSMQVVNRLHRRETAAPANWWQRLALDFELKPALVCALGLIVCGFLLVGIITSLRLEGQAMASLPPGIDQAAVLAPAGTPAQVASLKPDLRAKSEPVPPSTVPVLNSTTAPSPFNQVALHAQKVGFTLGFGGN